MNDEYSRAFGHVPVLGTEAVAALTPVDGGVYVDATLGGGGYTRMIFGEAGARVFGFDRDPVAIERAAHWAGAYGGRLQLVGAPFDEMEEALAAFGVSEVDGVVFDLGVSSVQLDEATRGFSFAKDGPLNMRMDQRRDGVDAEALVNEAAEKDLADIFYIYGEEKQSRGIARAICAARGEARIETTAALAAIVEQAVGPRRGEKIHPATRVFQAIRIFINDELGQLVRGLLAAERLLRPAGRLAVVSFHSLEDRIVKRFVTLRSGGGSSSSRHLPETGTREAAAFQLVSRKAIVASGEEVDANPRARSAKLRVAARTAAPAMNFVNDTARREFFRAIGLPQPVFSSQVEKWSAS